MSRKIRKGDTVFVLTGKDRGKSVKVLHLLPGGDNTRVIVEKINFIKRHMKPSQKQQQGGIVSIEAPLHISNVSVMCVKCGRPAKLASRLLDGGQKARVCKKCGEMVDKA